MSSPRKGTIPQLSRDEVSQLFEKLFLTQKDVAAILQVSCSTVRRLDIKPEYIAGTPRYPTGHFRRWLKAKGADI